MYSGISGLFSIREFVYDILNKHERLLVNQFHKTIETCIKYELCWNFVLRNI